MFMASGRVHLKFVCSFDSFEHVLCPPSFYLRCTNQSTVSRELDALIGQARSKPFQNWNPFHSMCICIYCSTVLHEPIAKIPNRCEERATANKQTNQQKHCTANADGVEMMMMMMVRGSNGRSKHGKKVGDLILLQRLLNEDESGGRLVCDDRIDLRNRTALGVNRFRFVRIWLPQWVREERKGWNDRAVYERLPLPLDTHPHNTRSQQQAINKSHAARRQINIYKRSKRLRTKVNSRVEL